MTILKRVLAACLLVSVGCGGPPPTAVNRSKPEALAAQQQTLAYVPPVEGGALLVAGSGDSGRADNANPILGTFSDPVSVLTLEGKDPLSPYLPYRLVYVADWGNNAIRSILEFGSPGSPPRSGLRTDFAYYRNLLNNPRAETYGSVPGWTKAAGRWVTAVSPCAACGGPADGELFFYAGVAGNSELRQDVDVSEYAQAIDNANGQFCFTVMARSFNEPNPDSTRVRLESLDIGGVPLQIRDTGEQWFTAAWTPIEQELQVPALTRIIRVKLLAARHGCSTCSNDGYFDGASLRYGPCKSPGVDRPAALAAAPVAAGAKGTRTVVGGKGLCYIGGDLSYTCPDDLRGLYVQALAAGAGRLYVASLTQGLGFFGIDVNGIPYPPFRKLVDINGIPLGWATGLAVDTLASGDDRVYFNSGWQPDPQINVLRGNRINVYDCTVATCGQRNAYSSTSGFSDARSGAVGGEAFRRPSGLAIGRISVDPDRDFFVADAGNGAIRRIFRQFVTTVGGVGAPGGGGDGGPSLSAEYSSPSGVSVAPNGDIYIADTGNRQVRKIVCAGNDICAHRERFNASTSSCDILAGYDPDDGNVCTDDQCLVLGIKYWQGSGNCSDGNLCNGNETCDGHGNCLPGTPPVVDDNAACTSDSCDPRGGVKHNYVAAGSPCSTGNACAPVGSCNGISSACIASPVVTDDGNDCTQDSCTATGLMHTPGAAGTPCRLRLDSSTLDGTCNATGGCIPNDASANANAINRSLPTPPSVLFGDFLGAGGSQAGSTACVNDALHPTCAFVPAHMALVRGTVADSSGAGLAGVAISVVNHPEFGSTQTLANGEYFFVVNGGAPLTIRASKAGLLSSDRIVNPAWGGTDFAKDIVLIAVDGLVTPVSFASSGGSMGWGANVAEPGLPTRQASVFFPQGVSVTADGASVASAKFRVTEFTVGSSGKDRMPAGVADNTMYTYAAEFTLEDATGKLYSDVRFSTPVITYVTNFLNMSVGEVVPVGYYNRAAARWEPMASGRVVQVASVSGGLATLSGLQAGDVPVSIDEQRKLGSYPVSTTLWRLPVSHFSPLDFNLGVGAPACETQNGSSICPAPNASQSTGGDDGPACGSCKKPGSIIDVERQVLRETFPVVGTAFSLNYSSENTLGYAWNKTLGINFENHPKHSKLKQFVVDFKVAGKRVVEGGIFPTGTYPSWTWPKSYQATWDGRDHDGRVVQGAVTATLDVGAVYKAERRGVVSFGSGGLGNAVAMPSGLSGTRQDPDITIWSRQTRQLQVWDASALGFGGWTLDVHHTFDPKGSVIYLGNGTHRKVDNLGSGVITLVAGNGGSQGTSPDLTAASSASFKKIEALAVNRDGEVYVAIPDDHVVRKISVANGQYTTVSDYAGQSGAIPTFGAPDAASGVAPVGAYLWEPQSIAVHSDGRLVIADRSERRIFEVGQDGKLRTLAGRGTSSAQAANCGAFTNGARAKDVDLCGPAEIATGPDGSVYFSEDRIYPAPSYIARIDPAGQMWLVGGGTSNGLSDYRKLPAGTLATGVQLGGGNGLVVDKNNNLWISADWDLLSVSTSGEVRDYPMNRRALSAAGTLDFALLPDGGMLRPVNDFGGAPASGGQQILRCLSDGRCTEVAGNQALTPNGTTTSINAAAVGNYLNYTHAVAAAPDGSVLFAHAWASGANMGDRIFRVAPQVVAPAASVGCVYKVPASDGSEYYCFDANGQHQSTVNALTNGTIRTFAYYTSGAATGLLKQIVEGPDPNNTSRMTYIDRSIAGVVTIKSPTAQQTKITLDDTKQLYAKAIAGAGSIAPIHDLNTGLLTALTDADSQPHSFTYDSFGRLQSDGDAAGGARYLARTEGSTGKYTVTSTTRLGKVETFSREILPDGTEQRVFGLLNGLTSTTNRDLAGVSSSSSEDGTLLKLAIGADPRWGMLTPFGNNSLVSFPAGPYSQSTTTTRTLSADGKTLTDVISVVGATSRSYKRVYSDATRTLELTTPLGRKLDYTFDAEGRVVSIQPPGVQRVDLGINSTTGRLDKLSQGNARVVNLAYSASGANQGFLTSVEDVHDSSNLSPLATAFAPDANGRPLSSARKNTATLQDVITGFGWTGSGRLNSVTPPGKSVHQLTYDARGLFQVYIPPTLGGVDEKTTFALDFDRYLQGVDAPGGDDVVITTDPLKGRTTSILVSGKNLDLAYYGPTGDASCPAGCAPGHLWTITDYRSSPVTITTTYKWINALPKSIDETLPSDGSAASTVAWTYNNDLRRLDETVSVPLYSSKATFGYDLDGLLTCASLGTCAAGQAELVSLDREPTTGALSAITVGASPTEALTYNAYGELRSQASTPFKLDYEDVSSSPNVLRDSLSRVRRRIERVGVGASARTFDYTYDDQNRLWRVGGAATSEYRYDSNGNRTYAKNSAGIVDGSGNNIVYDAQDRLIKYGTTSFDYKPKGDIWHRYAPEGTTTYHYDGLGALLSVMPPNGHGITYVVDGLGRRLAKMVDGVLLKQWIYGNGLSPLAELDGAGTVKMRFVYGSKPNVPDLIKTYPDNKVYRVFSDQLGSPRALFDVASGTIVKVMDFDEFGIKLTDTNASFEIPFGFAGGLYDPDTKLTRFGARDYDASIGRWVSKDPILFGGGQANLYVYVNNDPINFIDPTGKFINFAVGFVIGAGTDAAWQLMRGGCFQWGEFFIAGGFGALTGGLSAGTGVIASGAIGAFGSMGQYAATQSWYDRPITGQGLYSAGLLGGLGGALASGLSTGARSSGLPFVQGSAIQGAVDPSLAQTLNQATTSAATAFLQDSAANAAGSLVSNAPGAP